jgi:hypothetical protein
MGSIPWEQFKKWLLLLTPPFFALFDLQWVNKIIHIRVVHIYVAMSELSGQNIENSGFKRKGRFDNALAFC